MRHTLTVSGRSRRATMASRLLGATLLLLRHAAAQSGGGAAGMSGGRPPADVRAPPHPLRTVTAARALPRNCHRMPAHDGDPCRWSLRSAT